MKKLLVVCVMVLVVVLPFAGFAYENELEVILQSETGTLDYSGGDADYVGGVFRLSYARFFDPLETDGDPYGLRKYLQHPNYLGVEITGISTEIDDNFSSDKIEDKLRILSLGGEFYVTGGDNATGIGLRLESTIGDEKVSGGVNSDVDIKGSKFGIGVTQYLNRTVRLSASYTTGKTKYDFDGGGTSEVDERILELGASALIDKTLISAELSSGEEEDDAGNTRSVSSFGIGGTYYLNQTTSLGLEFSSEETEDESKISQFAFDVDHYFSDKNHLAGAIYSGVMDYDSASLDKLSYLGIGILYGLYF